MSYPKTQMDDLQSLSKLADVVNAALCSVSDSSFVRYGEECP